MKRIVIVDDDFFNLKTARAALKSEYEVVLKMDPVEACEYFKTESCDLVLLDINMPVMDGFQVLEQLQMMDNMKNVPVMFLTAETDAAVETKCFSVGALDFITKPFVPEVIKSRISRMFELEELRKNLAIKLEAKTKEVKEIETISRADALTGLWNRAYACELVNNKLKEDECGCVCMIDMDNFKAINDNYGHLAGDGVLKMFADTMRKYSKESDVLCRIGGDEFVMFVAGDYSKLELGSLAGNIIDDITSQIQTLQYDTNTSVSIGMAQYPGDGDDFNSLYNSADKALYHVKLNGKNSYHFYSDQSEQENKRGAVRVDLNYLKDIMSRGESNKGAYFLDFESFHHVYSFIKRFVQRCNRDVQILLFTVVPDVDNEDNSELIESALQELEKSVYTSLRRVDVSSRYSSRQLIVILMDTNEENGKRVADRILGNYEEQFDKSGVKIEYVIAQMKAERE